VLLRRATVILAAGSVALAGALYIQVSGAFAGLGEALLGGAQAAEPSSSDQGSGGGFGQAPQPAAVDPGSAAGQPMVRSGGS
jgi:hypothetical protein